jgi:putative CRISPR-associated protein (TIGR02619 family)
MTQPSFMISTCGTSLLYNQRSPTERMLVSKYANIAHLNAIPDEDAIALNAIVDQVRSQLSQASFPQVAVLSAELNALIKFYGGTAPAKRDYHLLLCTDTWLGEEAAKLAEAWLRPYGCTVEVKRQTDLQTAHLDSFQLALSDLVIWLECCIPEYRRRNYRIVFNLTGGFKSVQGFMQTLATFYADEVVYIFESGVDLMRIPRLPVKMAATETVHDHLTTFRRLALHLSVDNTDGIPETMLMRDEQSVTLSPWGQLVWEQTKKQIYTEQVYPSPSPKLKFGNDFMRSLHRLIPDRYLIVNERIDDLARYIETERRSNLSSLDFKQLQGNPRPPSTHECDAWADRDAKRLFGHFEGHVFVLDKLDNALH